MKTILVDAVYCLVVEKNGKFEVFENMNNLLGTYPNRKIVLTGANDEQFTKFNLADVPYEVFTLKHNPDKSNPKYYETLLNNFNLNKEDVIYFEHSEEAVKSAESIGIKSYWYNNNKKDLEGLKKFLDKNLD